jgi:hypothetical protein
LEFGGESDQIVEDAIKSLGAPGTGEQRHVAMKQELGGSCEFAVKR